MIVKCECDCKYCEKGYCTKEEIEIGDNGEGKYCDGYEQSEESFLNKFNFDWCLDDEDNKYAHVMLTSVFTSLGEVAKYMFETYPLKNIECEYYIFDRTLVGEMITHDRFLVSYGENDFNNINYSKKSAYVKNSCEMIRDYKLYDCGILTSV